MPDLSPLPPLGDTPRFAPSDERFAVAARTARRRRAVRTSVPAGAVAAAVLAAVVTTTTSTPSGLRPVAPGTSPSPTEAASPAPTPSAVGGSATGSPAPAPASSSPTPSAAGPAAGPSSAPPAAESPTPSPTRRAVYVSPQPVGSTPPPERNAQAGVGYQQLQPQGCGGAWGPANGGWCARYAGPRNVRAGDSMPFQFDICRTAADAGEIVFTGERELEFALAKGADRADAGGYTSRPGSGPHYITVAPGWCARWAAPWRVPADLPAGTYDLTWAVSGERPVMVRPEQRQVTVVRP